MVLNKDKSKNFKRVQGNIDVKKSLLIMLLGGTLMLSGCGVENVQDNNETVDTINNVAPVTEAPVKEDYKIYAPGEHRVFVCRDASTSYVNDNQEYLVSNIETPVGYQLVDTDYEIFAISHSYMAIINEYVNTIPVKVAVNKSNEVFQETSFGIPVEKEEEKENNKTLTKSLQ